MPEGIAVAGGSVAASSGIHDDPDSKPEPNAEAPRGWTWNRGTRSWKPKVKGKILWQDETLPGTTPGGPDPAGGPDHPGMVGGQDRDPAPAWARDDDPKPPPAGRLKFDEVPQDVKDDIAGLAGLIGAPVLGAFQRIDPYCGGALASCFEAGIDAALPLICRSSKIVRYFTEDQADWLLWGKLAMALAPVGYAFWEHHVVRSVEVVRDNDGNAFVRQREAGQGADHLQPPPVPEFKYAA